MLVSDGFLSASLSSSASVGKFGLCLWCSPLECSFSPLWGCFIWRRARQYGRWWEVCRTVAFLVSPWILPSGLLNVLHSDGLVLLSPSLSSAASVRKFVRISLMQPAGMLLFAALKTRSLIWTVDPLVGPWIFSSWLWNLSFIVIGSLASAIVSYPWKVEIVVVEIRMENRTG